KKEIKDAIDNLNDPDPDKKRAAQDKLDKTLGPDKRKEIEQLKKDALTGEPEKQVEANNKLEAMKEALDKKNETKKPPKPTKEEINDLDKKAQDLNSMDENKRKQAEKDLDAKIGEENRKKLQEEMNKKKTMDDPKNMEKLKDQLKEWREGMGGDQDLL